MAARRALKSASWDQRGSTYRVSPRQPIWATDLQPYLLLADLLISLTRVFLNHRHSSRLPVPCTGNAGSKRDSEISINKRMAFVKVYCLPIRL